MVNKPRTDEDYLQDILGSIDDAISFIKGMTFEEFKGNKKTLFAVIRCIEVIGEASTKLSMKTKDKANDVSWPEVIGMRNILIHEYFGIDDSIVWKAVKEDLPSLAESIRKLVQP